jgi:hypothetical protein
MGAASNRVTSVGGTCIAVVAIYRRINAACFRVARVIRAEVIVVADDRGVDTANSGVACVCGTFIIVVTS